MDLIPILLILGSLLLAHNAQHSLVLVVQEQYEQVPVLPRHPWVVRVDNRVASRIALISLCCTSPTLAVYRIVTHLTVPSSNGQE